VLGVSVAPSGKWFLFVSAISNRIVTPLLHILPNGLKTQAEDPLLSTTVIFPGILIALAHFVVLTYLYLNWFEKREVK
jgi:ABC-2 type transport system permease protein